MSGAAWVSLMPVPSAGANPYLKLLYHHLAAEEVRVFQDERYFRRRLSGSPEDIPQYLHYHWPESKYGYHAAWRLPDRYAWFFGQLALRKRAGVRVVWTLHNAEPHENSWPNYHRRAKAKMLSMSDLVLVNFEGARDFLAREYGRREDVYVVPHGSYRGYYPDTVRREEARLSLGIAEDRLVFLVFGDLRAYKNVDRILTAFARIPDPRLRLLIAGAPRHAEYGARIQHLASQDARVLLHMRRIPDEEIQIYFRASDLLVLGQRTFSSGSAVLGLDFGLPLLGLRVNHTAEIALGEALIALNSLEEAALVEGMRRASSMDLTKAREDAMRSSRALDWQPIARNLASVLRAHLGTRL